MLHQYFAGQLSGASRIVALAFVGAVLASVAYPQCPDSWDDAGVPISDPQPAPPPGTPELTVDGIYSFVLQQQLSSLGQLLDRMPPAVQKNYTMVESTRTDGLATLDHPRLILFGSDARFLMAMASHPNDEARETLDMAELDDETGFWVFRSLDMSATPPVLSKNDAACTGCHGIPARPIWGTYPDWPGIFGDDNDRLTASQADSLNTLRDTQAGSDRFHNIEFLNDYDTGDTFSLPGRYYPYTNTILNMELGAAVADGIYKRLSASPLYDQVQREILLMSYCSHSVPGFYDTEAYAQIAETLDQLGAASTDIEDIYRLLGVEPDNDLSLHRLAFEEPDPDWNVSTDSLFGLVDLLVLYEFASERPAVRQALLDLPNLETAFSDGCFDSLAESLAYKRYQGWTLRTEARQAARGARFDVDLLRSHQGIFDQADGVCDALMNSVVNREELEELAPTSR